ncbi:MAG: tRNA 2-thiouridine(34) synthase MnmA [Steroidobacteraceae bacterium]
MSVKSSDRVVVGLSGGVDSAVAALLLKEQGLDVHGLFMANWEEDDEYCTTAQDFQDARAVARELSIPLHRVSFAAAYREQVFDHFLREHRAGRTPNPDVLCNREVKFGLALPYARRLGARWFATGHYARIEGDGAGGVRLLKARDTAKDQSYFLHALTCEQLAATLMPLGTLHKHEVRGRARRAGLPVFDKPDSTGICFIGERPFRDFLGRYLADEPGEILSADGESLGAHRGLAFYTLGQREGLHVGGRRGRDEAPWYVAAKDAVRNALIVVQGHDHPLLTSHELTTGPMHWLMAAPPSGPLRCAVKVRYRQADQPAQLEPLADGAVRIHFEDAQRAVTPGQYAVVYDGDRCLGGAVIESVASARYTSQSLATTAA